MNLKDSRKTETAKGSPLLKMENFLAAIIFSSVLAILIIASGSSVLLKITFILIGIIISLFAVDTQDIDKSEDKALLFKRYLFTIFIAMILLEIPLYMNSNYKKTVPVEVVPINKTSETRNEDGQPTDINYTEVNVINLTKNKIIDKFEIKNDEKELLRMWTDITSKTYYIDYFPFFVYSEEIKYNRAEDNQTKHIKKVEI